MVFVIILIPCAVVVTTITYPIIMKRTRTKIGLNGAMMMIYTIMRGLVMYSPIPQRGDRHLVWRL